MDTPDSLRAKAEMCRRLAKGANERTRDELLVLAVTLEAEAAKLEPL